MLRIKFVINNVAGKIQNGTININSMIKAFSDHKILSEIMFTKKTNLDKDLFLYNLDQKDAIVVCGGDGTLNKIITYMINNNIDLPFLFIPGGTANVFNFEKHLTTNINKIIRVLRTFNYEMLDIGYIKHQAKTNYFLMMLGIGFDSKSVNDTDINIKKILGKTSYIVSGLKNIITYKSKQLDIIFENGEFLEGLHSIIVTNGRFYGGNIELFPNAKMDDGLLDVYAFRASNNIILLKDIIDISYGKINKNIQYFKVKNIKIISKNSDMPFQIDGECLGNLPVEVGVLHKKLKFILPK